MLGGLPQNILIAGAEHDLSHLTPFIYTYAGHGTDGADLRVRVTFTSHVFSTEPQDGEVKHFDDKNGKGRCFCPVRYGVSIHLPGQVQEMLAANAWSWVMKDKNGYANLGVLTNPKFKLLNGTYNVVIYYFFPAKSPDVEVEMMVMSCYSRPINFKNHTTRSPMRTLAKQSHFQQIRVPKN